MKRITVEMLLEAFQKTGLTPMQGDYFPSPGCACGLGVIYYQFSGVANDEGVENYLDNEYDGNYKRGFAEGFDNRPNRLTRNSEEWCIGYEDGQAAWDAVKHLATVE